MHAFYQMPPRRSGNRDHVSICGIIHQRRNVPIRLLIALPPRGLSNRESALRVRRTPFLFACGLRGPIQQVLPTPGCRSIGESLQLSRSVCRLVEEVLRFVESALLPACCNDTPIWCKSVRKSLQYTFSQRIFRTFSTMLRCRSFIATSGKMEIATPRPCQPIPIGATIGSMDALTVSSQGLLAAGGHQPRVVQTPRCGANRSSLVLLLIFTVGLLMIASVGAQTPQIPTVTQEELASHLMTYVSPIYPPPE
jgi:hypothetical protein